ncbi:DNA polymerase III subunit tau [Maioricimonas rarisocia]|uniref:DNA polymerase III subunit gamma/tau n=1 Tax=Maioricimonas rarisocia TaxID=2528026 RepID=A0A517Z7K8_9PLAN|nr:DNA polymerase III subunit gamma/tau [Maioricimonas rarisocia]QDU38439.1 DNA polymerase III subunit tau [Maioricimonas rarisocia]
MVDNTAQYTVLARRFRPQTFDEVVGQQHVGQALRNAIKAGRVAHAYLFTGARGVGKTSTARILAKALNCPNAVDGLPCNECEICRGISTGGDVDVLEIDGASNRGIDDIRQLRANVSVRSMRSQYKVYIIDEVHMLTKEAFNALLKTLEEPPPNVKFVFCTTEPNKVPDTILSRCQRFDFGTIATGSIAERLRQIASAEQIEVDDDAVELVARRGAGSMRDSQSLFDQLLAFGGEHITTEDVHQLLGTAPDERLVEAVGAIISGNRKNALTLVEDALQQGVQLGAFSDQLLHYFRDLLIVAAEATGVPLVSVAERHREDLARQARTWGLETVTAAMQVLADTKARMQRVNHGRALLDLAIVRLSLLENLQSISQAVAQVGGLQTARPAASPASGSSGARALREAVTGQPSAPAQAAKKNDSAPPDIAPPAEEDTPQPVQKIAFTAENADQVWAQVLSRAPEKAVLQYKNASRVAIFEPNVLEITFPASYLFSKNYCERPESTQRLREAVEEICGQEANIRLKLESAPANEAAPEEPGDSPRSAEPVRRRRSSVEQDPYVQQALAVFGGSVLEVHEVTSWTAQDAEEQG